MQQAQETGKSPAPRKDSTMPTTRAHSPDAKESLAYRIAGNVITESVT